MSNDPHHSPEMDEGTRRELVQLADGKLGGSRRAALEARVANSPDLAAGLRRQLVAATALRSLELGAPVGLRDRLERERQTAKPPPRRFVALGGFATAAAAAALLLFTFLPTGGGEQTLHEATQLAARPATQATGPAVASNPKLLAKSGDGVAFPNLEGEFGWRPAGSRSDELDGREATTVYYERGERRIGYTILAGEAIEPPPDSRTTRIAGVDFSGYREEGMQAVTWQRQGRTCVLAGRGVSEAELVELASWPGKGAVTF